MTISIIYVDDKTKIEVERISIISIHSLLTANTWWMIDMLYSIDNQFIINNKKDKTISILIDSKCFDYEFDKKKLVYQFKWNNIGKLQLL